MLFRSVHLRELATAYTETCRFCQEQHTVLNIGKHERFCYKNPNHPRRRECVTCGKWFVFPAGKKGAQQKTCSRSCSNTQYRSGTNNGNWKHPDERSDWDVRYRTRCFSYHEKKCVVCGETNIVAVHHMDGDHANETPENLIPLCPTHHAYWHSRFRHLIEEKVLQYIEEWKHRRVG